MIVKFIKDWPHPQSGNINKAGSFNQFKPSFAQQLQQDGFAVTTPFNSMKEAYASIGKNIEFDVIPESDEPMDKDNPDLYIRGLEEE